MAQHKELKYLPYHPDQIFDLVADVERYPEFLPWCERLALLSRETRDMQERLIAEMTVSFNVYRERFRTEVLLDREARTIEVTYLDGPFKYLENDWRFAPEGEGTLADFRIAFEFKSRALQLVAGFFFDEAFRRLVAAFDARARFLYGRRTTRARKLPAGRRGSSGR